MTARLTHPPGEPAADTRGVIGTVAGLATSEIAGKVATLFTFVLAARVLGVDGFGVFSYGLGIGLLLAVVASLGLDTRLVQLGSADREALPAVLAALLLLRIAIGVTLVGGTWWLAAGTGTTGDVLAVLIVLVAASVLDTGNDAFRGACNALGEQRRAAAILVVQRLLTLLGTLIALWAWTTPLSAAVAYLAGVAGGVAAMAWNARRLGVQPAWSRARTQVRPLLVAVPVLGANAVTAMALFRLNTVLVGLLLGTAAVGVYATAYRLLETMLFVSWSLSRTLLPMLASSAEDRDATLRWARFGVTLNALVYLPYAAVLAARGNELIALLFGADYAQAPVVAALSLAPLAYGLAHLFSTVLLARHPDPRVLLASALALAVNVTANLLLIPRLGVVGAALATTAAYVVQALTTGLAVRSDAGPCIRWRTFAVLTLAAGAAAAAMLTPLPLALALPAGGVTFLALAVLGLRLVEPQFLGLVRSLRGGKEGRA